VSEANFLPYGRQSIEQDDIDAVVEVLRGDYLTTGPAIERFERALAAAVGAEAAVAVSSGTAALHAACFAAGVDEGDEVVVPAVSFLATANCARFLHAEPIFADVDPASGLVLPSEVERLVGPKTKAVIPVHLNGVAADMPAIWKAAGKVGATVIEDAAHALGGLDDGRPIGNCADRGMAMFSFHPVKQITTGEGGAVTTNDPEFLRRLRLCRNHGMVRDEGALRDPSPGPWYYEQQVLGHNLRLTDLQAALGFSQLAKLGRFVSRRRELAARYDDLLSELTAVSPVVPSRRRASSAYHLYAVSIDFDALGVPRAEVMRQLRERGIGTQVHFMPIPGQPYYRERGWRVEDFPGARRYYERVLSLPLFPAMEDGDVDRVATALAEVLEE
jgi:perosamine synthetase